MANSPLYVTAIINDNNNGNNNDNYLIHVNVKSYSCRICSLRLIA